VKKRKGKKNNYKRNRYTEEDRNRWENGSKRFIKERWEGGEAFLRINGTVIRVGSEEKRSEIMRNKHKLKRSIFIENDLNWEERKIQKRINK